MELIVESKVSSSNLLYRGLTLAVIAFLLALTPACASPSYQVEYQQGVEAYKRKAYDNAAHLLWKSIVDGNKGPEPWLLMGHSYYGQGKIFDAAKAYKTVVETFKGTPEAAIATQYMQKLGPDALKQPDGLRPVIQEQATTKTALATTSLTNPVNTTAGATNLVAATNTSGANSTRIGSKSFIQHPTNSSRTASAPAPQVNLAGLPFKDRIEIVSPVDGHPAVTPDTVALIKKTITTLPPSIYKILDQNGVSTHLAPNLVDKWPQARLEPRADGSNLSTDIGRTYGRDMYICQQIIEPSTNQVRETCTPTSIQATYLNEVGHALDDVLKFSSAADVSQAYDQDMQNLRDDLKVRFWLYVLPKPQGQCETCAELVAAMLGGKGYNTELMPTNFPHTYQAVRKHLQL